MNIGSLGNLPVFEKTRNDTFKNADEQGFKKFLEDLEKKGPGLNPYVLFVWSENPAVQNVPINEKLTGFADNGILNPSAVPKGIEAKSIETKVKTAPLNQSLEFSGQTKAEVLGPSDLFLSQRDYLNRVSGKHVANNAYSKILDLKEDGPDPQGKENVIRSSDQSPLWEEVANLKAKDLELSVPKTVKKNDPNTDSIAEFIEKNGQLKEISNPWIKEQEPIKFKTDQELFEFISQIISKNKIKTGETLSLKINDNTLGEFLISAQNGVKNGGIMINIASQNRESSEFFKGHENDILQSLEKAGVKVGELKIVSIGDGQASNKVNADLVEAKGENPAGGLNEHFNDREQLEKDSRRRKEIWRQWTEGRRV
jgi:hypothetical protein